MKKILGQYSLALSLAVFAVACSSEDSGTNAKDSAKDETKASTTEQTTEDKHTAENKQTTENKQTEQVKGSGETKGPEQTSTQTKKPKKKRSFDIALDEVEKDIQDLVFFSTEEKSISQKVVKIKAGPLGTNFALVDQHNSFGTRISSELVQIDKKGDVLWSYTPATDNDFIQDFDITPAGLPVIIKTTDRDFLRILVWTSLNEKPNSFFVFDKEQNKAVGYDPLDNVEIPVEITDYSQKRFHLRIAARKSTNQARIVANSDAIYVSAIGYSGEKVFAFDYSGKEKWQTLVFPYSTLRSGSGKFSKGLDQAPRIVVNKDKIFASTFLDHRELNVLDKYLSQKIPNLEGISERSALIQILSLDGKRLKGTVVPDQFGLDLLGLKASSSGIIVYAETGSGQDKQGQTRLFDENLKEIAVTENPIDAKRNFQFKDLIALSNGDFLLAGNCDGEMDENGKLLTTTRGCLFKLDSQGKMVSGRDLPEDVDQYEIGISSVDVDSHGKILVGGLIDDISEKYGLSIGWLGFLQNYQMESGPFVAKAVNSTPAAEGGNPGTGAEDTIKAPVAGDADQPPAADDSHSGENNIPDPNSSKKSGGWGSWFWNPFKKN